MAHTHAIVSICLDVGNMSFEGAGSTAVGMRSDTGMAEVATEEPKKEEPKQEEEEDSDEDFGFGLFD